MVLWIEDLHLTTKGSKTEKKQEQQTMAAKIIISMATVAGHVRWSISQWMFLLHPHTELQCMCGSAFEILASLIMTTLCRRFPVGT